MKKIVIYMTKGIQFTETDTKLKRLCTRRKGGLSDNRKQTYNNVFNEIYKLTGYTPSDIVRIAKEEEKGFIKNGIVEKIDIDDRTVTEIQFKYADSLNDNTDRDKPLTPATKELKMLAYRSLLSEYQIEKPLPIDFNNTRERVRDSDIPSWRDVEKAMSLIKSPRDKAILGMAATTGLRVSDLVKLDINDFITACSIYFDEDEEHTLENLLKKNPDHLVPCWELNPKKTDKFKIFAVTYNTPEVTNYLFDYLKYRINLDERKGGDGTIGVDEALFANQRGGFLQTNSVGARFREINRKMGGERDRNGIYSKFRIHNLRTLFQTTCRRSLPQVVVKSDKTFEGDLVNIFTGHSTKDNPLAYAYEAIPNDSHDSYIRKAYEALIPFLSIQPTDVKDFKTENYKEWEEEKDAIQKRMDVQAVQHQREMEEKDKEIAELKQTIAETQKQVVQTNKAFEELTLKRDRLDIRNIIQDHFNDNYRDTILQKEYEKDGEQSIGLKKCVVICEIAWEIALENESNFKETDDFLDSLIRQAIAKCSFNPKMIIPKYNEIHERNIQLHDINGTIYNIVADVITILAAHEDVWDMVKNDQKTLKTAIINHIHASNYDIDNITLEDEQKIAEEVSMEYLAII